MPAPGSGDPLAAVLAAGLARRFGGGKLDTPVAGKPLGQWALDKVLDAGLEPGVIVTGPGAPRSAQAATDWQLLTNPVPEDGLGTSVATACRHARDLGRDLLLLLADMPLVSVAHIQALVRVGGNAATLYPDGRAGVPALIGHEHLDPFCDLAGERGAGPLLARLDGLQRLGPPPDMLADVDRPQDLARVERLLQARGSA